MDRYGTAEGFRSYCEARGKTVPASWTDDVISEGLLVASEFVDGRYGSSYPGNKAGGRSQARLWPRIGASDVNGDPIAFDEIPLEVENATYEATFIHRTTPGSLYVNFTPNKYKQASVTGAVSVTYATFNYASEAQPQFATIDAIIAPVLSGDTDFSPLSGPTTRR